MITPSPAKTAAPIIDTKTVSTHATNLFSDSLTWLQRHWLEIGIATLAGAAIVVVLHLIRNLGIRICRRHPDETGWATIIGRAVARTGNFFMVTAAARLVIGYAVAPPGVAQTIDFLFTVAAVFQAAIWAREIILGLVEHRTQAHGGGGELGSAISLIRVLVTVALFAVALIVVLDNLGVNVTGLVAGLGVGGIAIGLAAQGIFADLFAALSIIFDRPFRKGDAISYDSSSGTVEEIGLKSTRLRSITGEERIISNRKLLDKEIQNNTRRDRRRIKFAIGLIYQTPPEVAERVPALLRALVEERGMVFIRCGFINFGASSLDYEVEFDSPSADYQAAYDARHAIGIAILKLFDEQGIGIAYPTQVAFTAAPDGTLIPPYPDVQAVHEVAGKAG